MILTVCLNKLHYFYLTFLGLEVYLINFCRPYFCNYQHQDLELSWSLLTTNMPETVPASLFYLMFNYFFTTISC